MVSRYAPYLAYPRARYSVGVTSNGSGAKITAMRNPWMRFKSVPLGEIFRQYGGGGHQRVASVLVPRASDAETTLGAIVRDIKSQTASAAARPKRSVSS
jgi:nanoRNase/pAp phosphatase (c-di-AMP/oligoRNAs hydrolase)